MIDFLEKRDLIEKAILEIRKARHFLITRPGDVKNLNRHILELDRARAQLEACLALDRA